MLPVRSCACRCYQFARSEANRYQPTPGIVVVKVESITASANCRSRFPCTFKSLRVDHVIIRSQLIRTNLGRKDSAKANLRWGLKWHRYDLRSQILNASRTYNGRRLPNVWQAKTTDSFSEFFPFYNVEV